MVKTIMHSSPILKFRAFTLAEMLMAVLVMSIIMTALAPVITKRVADNISLSVAKSDGRLFVYDINDPNCTTVTELNGASAVDCTFVAPTESSLVNAILVSGGGGGAGATDPTVTNETKTVNTATETNVTITADMKDVVISYLVGGGGGGGGAAFSQSNGGSPTSQASCDSYNAKFLNSSQNGGKAVCVTKFNVGDTNGPPTASGTSVVSAGTSCTADKCCWGKGGTTSSNCTNSGSWAGGSSSYSGCTRTVCTWYAADAACKAYAPSGTSAGDWRLPTQAEMAAWKTKIDAETASSYQITKYMGSNGLQLCDYNSSSYGAVRCASYGGRCPGYSVAAV